jgi:hypothetical protein
MIQIINMNLPSKKSLSFHLLIIIVIKLIGLFLLWWFFVRSDRQMITAEKVGTRFYVNKLNSSKDNSYRFKE